MNFSKRNRSIVDFLFILALFGAFAITGLLVVLFGSRVYKSTVAKMDMNYSARTSLSYVTEKIRSHDYTGGIDVKSVETLEEASRDVLLLKETLGDKTYVTYLYADKGMLKEFTTSEEYDFDFTSGTQILAVKEFSAEKVNDSLVKINIKDSYDNSEQFFVALYSGTDGEVEQ